MLTVQKLVKNVSQISSRAQYIMRILNTEVSSNFSVDEAANLLKVNPNYFSSVIQKPELQQCSLNQWKHCFTTLENEGFLPKDCLRMVDDYPVLLQKTESYLGISIENWRSCQFGEPNLLDLLATYPYLLDVPFDNIQKRIPILNNLVYSDKNVYKLIYNNPSVMFKNWGQVRAIIDYVTKVMKLEASEIYKSNVFELTHEDLQCRHVFLERVGIYKTPKRKDVSDNPILNKNPKLSAITVEDEQQFLSKTGANLTIEEFEVFKELYKAEIENETDDNISDEESTDDD